MRHKISKAPAPTKRLPISNTPELEPPTKKPKPEPKQPTASYYRFLRAVHQKDRRAAEFYAQKCRDEGLPEAQLKELSLLDVYPTRKRGPEPTKRPALEKAMRAYIQQEGLDNFFKMKKEELAAHFKASTTTAWEVRKAIASKLQQNSD